MISTIILKINYYILEKLYYVPDVIESTFEFPVDVVQFWKKHVAIIIFIKIKIILIVSFDVMSKGLT